MSARDSYDVVVVGGGAMGSATAWHLLAAAPGVTVAVVEPDPAYAGTAASAASGGVRQLFSRPENVLMSRYTHEVIEQWAGPGLGWHPNGYLFITEPGLSGRLRADYELQRSLGVENEWLEPGQIAERYPLIATADLGPAVLSPRDGWLDPASFLRGMVARGRSLGAVMVDAPFGDVDGEKLSPGGVPGRQCPPSPVESPVVPAGWGQIVPARRGPM
jgi:FAD-dependent oxidoreductase domain-containing protein 1